MAGNDFPDTIFSSFLKCSEMTDSKDILNSLSEEMASLGQKINNVLKTDEENKGEEKGNSNEILSFLMQLMKHAMTNKDEEKTYFTAIKASEFGALKNIPDNHLKTQMLIVRMYEVCRYYFKNDKNTLEIIDNLVSEVLSSLSKL